MYEHELIERNIYHYDIEKCNYQLLKSINWDVTNIPEDNKLERNIHIGYLQKENPKLAYYLIKTTEAVIDYYLQINGIKDSDIILRQRDGIYSRKRLTNTSGNIIPLAFKYIANIMIFGTCNNQYLIHTHNNKIIVKGIRNKPINISFFEKFKNFNYANKKIIISQLERFRKEIFISNQIEWFTQKNDDCYYVPLINREILKLSNLNSLSMIDLNEIDKSQIWNNIIYPFIQTIMLYIR